MLPENLGGHAKADLIEATRQMCRQTMGSQHCHGFFGCLCRERVHRAYRKNSYDKNTYYLYCQSSGCNARGAKGAGHRHLARVNRQREGPDVQWKAAAFARWHEPDDARVSSPVL